MIKYINQQVQLKDIANDFKNNNISQAEFMNKSMPIIDYILEQEIKVKYDFNKFANIDKFGLTNNNKSDIMNI